MSLSDDRIIGKGIYGNASLVLQIPNSRVSSYLLDKCHGNYDLPSWIRHFEFSHFDESVVNSIVENINRTKPQTKFNETIRKDK